MKIQGCQLAIWVCVELSYGQVFEICLAEVSGFAAIIVKMKNENSVSVYVDKNCQEKQCMTVGECGRVFNFSS